MTEKRFRKVLGFIADYDGECYEEGENFELLDLAGIENRLNELHEENEQLKQQINCHKSRIQLLSPLLDLADTIIDLSDDEKAKAFWEKRNNEVEQEWNKILKGDDVND